jgi:hypothetical protein
MIELGMGDLCMADTTNKEPPLTDEEKRLVREFLRQDANVTWLWSTVKVWALWLSAISAAIALSFDHLKRFGRAIAAFWGAL